MLLLTEKHKTDEWQCLDSLLPDTSRLYAINAPVRRYQYLKDGYKPHSFSVSLCVCVSDYLLEYFVIVHFPVVN
jgi:hypothetical protein